MTAKTWIGPIQQSVKDADLSTDRRFLHWMTEVCFESGRFVTLEENLNYSAGRLLEVFPEYFKTLVDAQVYEHHPQMIANRVYANKNGNGPESSGDGWRFHGRGPIQATEYGNYKAFEDATGLPVASHPDLMLTPEMGCRFASWFWRVRKINVAADADDIKEVTRLVNGGYNGLAEREAMLKQFTEAVA